MSSIIDDLVFYREKNNSNHSTQDDSIWSTLEQLSKNFSINQGAILLNSNRKNYETLNKLKHQNHEYSTRLSAQASLRSVRVEVRLLQENQFQKINSKHNEILLLKEVAKRQFQSNCEYPFCVVKGCVIMVQKMYFYVFDSCHKKKAIEFYNAIFTKIFKQFEDFINQQANLIYKVPSNNNESDDNLNEDLFLIHSLCTSCISFDVSEESTNFEEIVQANRRQQKELKNIIDNLQQSNTVQQITDKLFCVVNNNLECQWVRENLEARFCVKFNLFAKLLGIAKFIGEKKIDDFIFNMVKIKIKQVVPRPFGEGGSCQLFLAKAEMTFINSVDNTSYFKNQDRKEKVIAIKKLKPELQNKMKCKLDHQKSIVSKLKGGVSYFIPKYYRVEAQLETGDALLMEYIQGEELDYFIACRQQTISLCTKLCVLLNVVHGMRHLANNSITHLDLKPINVIVCRNNYLISKIIDFGQAHHPQVCSPNYCPGYTFPYVSPEVYIHANPQNQDYEKKSKLLFSEKQDVFAFGFIMYEIIFNNKMFQFTPQKYHEIYSKKQILQRVLFAYERLEDYGQYTAISLLTHLIIRCLDPDPQKRPRFDWIGISLRIILNTCSGTA